MMTPALNLSAFPLPRAKAAPAKRAKRSEPDPAPFGFVTAERLISLGIVANALFWCGLLVPFNPGKAPEIAMLHAFVTMIGFGLALGGLVAVILMAVHEINTKLFAPHIIAAALHSTVVASTILLLVAASLRGWFF